MAKIVICMPCAHISRDVFLAHLGCIPLMQQRGLDVVYSIPSYDPNIYYARTKCLGGSVLAGTEQKPFQGMEYDYIMWIDSDIIFTGNDIVKLIERKLDVVSGLYHMRDGRYPVVTHWDIEYFKKNGTFHMLTEEEVAHLTEPFEVIYTGLGFMLMKKGVLESIKYPWFQPVMHEIDGNIKDFASEDASLCYHIRQAGYKIFVDPTVKVGHEKSFII